MQFDIKVGSVTNAQRGKKALRLKGINATFHRLQNPQQSDGCGYALAVNDKDFALEILQQNGIKVLGVDEL